MAQASKSCCIKGHLHEGPTNGQVITIKDSLQTYVAGPIGPSEKVILLLTDVFGFGFQNIRLYADQLSLKTGLPVYVPDLFDGDALDFEKLKFFSEESNGMVDSIKKGFKALFYVPSFLLWLRRHGDSPVLGILQHVHAFLKTQVNAQSIAVQGFCFGGRYAVLMAGNGEAQVMIANHPSRTELKDFEKVNIPNLIQSPEDDPLFSASMREKVKEILSIKNSKESKMLIYPGQMHGFTLRGDESKPEVVQAASAAFEATAEFITKHL